MPTIRSLNLACRACQQRVAEFEDTTSRDEIGIYYGLDELQNILIDDQERVLCFTCTLPLGKKIGVEAVIYWRLIKVTAVIDFGPLRPPVL